MDIGVGERERYVKALHCRYGKEVAGGPDMDRERQRCFEMRRHQWNSRFAAGNEDLDPVRLLIAVTQRCTFRCPHCWVFASPSATASLSCGQLAAIQGNLPPEKRTSWTLSGGEVFTLPDYAEVIASYPIHCIYTNGFWGESADKCRTVGRAAARAIRGNPQIDASRFTLIISYDRYHRQGSGGGICLPSAIARIIATLYEEMAEITLRISHTVCGAEKDSYWDIFDALRQMGYHVAATAHAEHNGNIRICSFSYRRDPGPEKEIFVDCFPLSPVCRALFLTDTASALRPVEEGGGPLDGILHGRPLARYQYTIGPDGGVGVYDVLHAPPVPYLAGNLVREPWRRIAGRLARDPIAQTLRRAGPAPMVQFMKIFYPELSQSLLRHCQTIQQLLYLILLDPMRRLFLNTYLLSTIGEQGGAGTIDKDVRQAMAATVAISEPSERTRALARLYEVA